MLLLVYTKLINYMNVNQHYVADIFIIIIIIGVIIITRF